MTRSQLKAFRGLSISLAIVIALTIFTNLGLSEESVLVTSASIALCSSAIFFWVKQNPADIQVMLSNEPDWLVWGKNKHGFWVYSIMTMAWFAVTIEDYLTLGHVRVASIIVFLISVTLLAMFIRECRKNNRHSRNLQDKS